MESGEFEAPAELPVVYGNGEFEAPAELPVVYGNGEFEAPAEAPSSIWKWGVRGTG